jgi:hypothetical protein
MPLFLFVFSSVKWKDEETGQKEKAMAFNL